MSTTTTTTFDLTAPLAPGRLVIEASAGTGKTYTLAALATRFLAEQGVSASELLVVTFTRAATAELRGRMRDRIVEAAAVLAGDGPVPEGDPLLVHLASSDRRLRHDRLARAVTEFDAATIATIHGFATQALGTLGLSTSGDRDAVLVDDVRELQGEICADVLAGAAAGGHAAEDLPKLNELIEAVSVATRTADLGLAPTEDEEAASPKDHVLRTLVGTAVGRAIEQRRRAGTRSFDELLTDLRSELHGPNAASVRTALRSRYRVALIDEFQDTDPVQWGIFSELFGDDQDSSLVLVGDPKQAIYSFRGADIGTYVAATAAATNRHSLGVNYRSDDGVLRGLDVLLRGVTFGDPSIAFSSVAGAGGHGALRIAGADGQRVPAVSLRLALGDDLEHITKGKPPPVSSDGANLAVRRDLVTQVHGLLTGATLPGDGGAARAVRPSDIAVLTRTISEGEDLLGLLTEAGIPAVLARGGSVLESPAADQWRLLLAAMARPADARRARAVALSWFGGRDASWVATAEDDEIAALQDQLHTWSTTLVNSGVEAMVRRVWRDSDVAARVLAQPDGDRSITDLDHLAELLRTVPTARRPGIAGLAAVLEREPDADVKADAELEGNLASRRIASEAEAVQVMTTWVAKGLQFPIVCVPNFFRPPRPRPVIFDGPEGRVLDLSKGKDWPDKKEAAARKAASVEEALGEDLRLLYVALTRAQHHVLLWWSRVQGSEKSALGRVLFARDGAELDPEAFSAVKVRLPADDLAADALAPLVDAAAGEIGVAVHGLATETPTWVDRGRTPASGELEVAPWSRTLPRTTERWSFTKVTAEAHGQEPTEAFTAETDEGQGGSDEGQAASEESEPAPAPAPAPDAVDPVGGAVAPPMAALPAGATFGTMVHAILERVDFTSTALADDIGTQLDQELAWRPFDLTPDGESGHPETKTGRSLLVDGLVTAIETPLGAMFGGRRLRDIAPADRVDEMDFEIRLADGGRAATDRQIGALVLDHLAPTDPYRRWAQDLAAGVYGVVLDGHLTGSIDLVCRVLVPDGQPRYVIADYKTNRLHRRGALPEDHHYRDPSMVAAMVEHHYPLQALLYSVALHRYLRWRQPGYDPTVHLGGAAYLFVRGMTGPVEIPEDSPSGVASWAVPPNLVVELSDLLAGSVR